MADRSRWLVDKTEVVSDEAIVAAMHPLASEAGAEMLRRGGNAVDAAVAAAFALGVVEPHMSGVGGIAQLVYREAATGRTCVVDGTSTLPRAIVPGMFELLDPGRRAGLYLWRAVKDDANTTGYRAPAVPGMPAAMCAALARFGRLGRDEVLAPAIRYAEEGFEVDWALSLYMAGEQTRLARLPEARRTFYKPDGSCYRSTLFNQPPEVLRQPDLARTLRLIAERGPEVVYRGEIAALIAEDMAANGGLISRTDLADYAVRFWEPGLIGAYRGHGTVQAPRATGAPTVLEMLNILEGFDLAGLGHNSVGALHLIAEAQRRAFLDRFAHLGDPALHAVPYEGIVSKPYAAHRRGGIDPERATPEATAGDPWPFEADGPPAAVASAPAVEGGTTHVTVIDRDRSMVALTSTLGTGFGCGVVVPGTGILLNGAASWFDPEPGRVNSIGPGKRILWAGTPTLVLRDGEPFFAVGAPGGRKILSAVLQTVLNVVDYGMGPQAAVSAPRVHCEGPDMLVDARLGDGVVDGLRRRGHAVVVAEEGVGTWHFGRPSMVVVEPGTGRLRGGVHPYSPATAVGL